MHFVKFLSLCLNSSISSTEVAEPSITYLKGSCSAGKATLIRSLLNQHSHLEVVDEDTIMQQSYVNAVAARFPMNLAILSKR